MNESKENLLLVFFTVAVVIAMFIIPNNDVPKHEVYYEPHVVKQGETLSEIVEYYHGSLKKTQALYPGNANVIMPGEVVNVVIEGR